MKYITGVALASWAEQKAGGDKYPVHPDVIKVTDQHVPVYLNFETAMTVGKTTRLFRADDRIMFEAEINDEYVERVFRLRDGEAIRYLKVTMDTAAIGYTLNEYTSDKRLIPGGTIHCLGLVASPRNENSKQPQWEEFTPRGA